MVSQTDTHLRKFALAILFSLLASPAWATTYYLATAAGGGSDSNNGTSSGSPWLTPNHAVNCGDTITSAASTSYSAVNFASGKWGTVTCPAGNNVAWLKCATFDGCKISGLTSLQNGMTVSASYWGVQGWEVDGTSVAGYCFLAIPPSSTATIHHIIFANNIAIGCGLAGLQFSHALVGGIAVDYGVQVGNIAYGTSGGSSSCGSGLYVFSPVASDSLPGTHFYFAGNFSWDNVNPNPCGGTTPTDGNGLILDTLDYTFGSEVAYAQQMVVDNNILVANGGRGLEVVGNNIGGVNAHIYFRNNTVWGNNTDLNQTGACNCIIGEIVIIDTNTTEVFQNIAVTNATDGANGYPIYDFWATTPSATDSVYQNIGYAASGTYSAKYDPSSLFSYGPNNLFGTNPSFANPVAPGAPSCGSATSVPNCMATVIANFTPTNTSAIGYGYQIPSATQTYDPLFPQWLCNATLPTGLVTMGCLAASSLPASVTITGVTIQ